MRSGWPRRLAVVALLAGAVAALRFTVFRPEPIAVAVARVTAGRVEETVTNSKAGTVKTRRHASLSPEIGGRIEALPARKGERVAAGALLLRIAAAELEADVALHERSLEAGRAAKSEACEGAAQATRERVRIDALARARVASADATDRAQASERMARSACEAAGARLRQAEAGLARARVMLAKSELRAPFAGVVAEISAELGEWITPSPPGVPMPAVIDLLDPEAIYVSAPLDEVDVAKVRTGLPVRVTLDAWPGRAFAGKVTRVAPYVLDVQQQSRTFEIEVELEDAAFARALPPGISADVEVVLAVRDGVLRLPANALLEGGGVLVLENGEIVSRAVETGLRNWEYAEVRSGLRDGDLVVTSLDRAEVKAGARARAEPAPGGGGGAAAEAPAPAAASSASPAP